ASILIPPAWALVARDAFNGVALWKRTIPKWEDHLRGFRSGPPELSRTLVATPDAVYVTLSQRAHVTALDPCTGAPIQEYPQTAGTEEILLSDGILYLATRASNDKNSSAAEGTRGLMAVNARTGSTVWQRPDADPLSMSLAVAGGRVIYMTLEGVYCLDAATGKELWHTARDVATRRPGWSSPTVVMHDDVVLVADRWTEMKDTIDAVTGKPVARWLAQEGWTGDLIAYSAQTGAELWQCRCAESYHAPPDVFVADGLVWVGQSRSRTGPDFVAGRDPRTGEIKRELETDKAWDTTMPHHRCHRNRATQQYIIAGRTGVEFIDLATGNARRHHWTRGTCQFGTLPANGLLYVPPHSCACFIESKLTGFLALAPRAGQGSEPGEPRKAGERLQRGPKYDAAIASSTAGENDWPTYRHDPLRSGHTPQEISAEIGSVWEADFGGKISSPTIADGRVYVATVDKHRVHALDVKTGVILWTFAAGGRIDSPPTLAAGRVVFGSADGYVYCLDAGDGQLIWRCRAAAAERRVVAFNQLESTWPVHGSVLVLDGAVYCAAGRSSYLDGGIALCKLDLKTGATRAQREIYSRDPETGEQPDEPITFEMPGALPDVLASDGKSVFMRRLAFDPRTLQTRPAGKHVYSPAGFLNDNWWHRTYWIDGTHFYSGYIGWYFAGREAPAGRLLTFTDKDLVGYGYAPDYYRGSRGRKYNLFALDRSAQPEQPPADYRRANRDYPHSGPGSFRIAYRWSTQVPLLVRGMVLTDGKVFVAGPPENALDKMSVFAGQQGARLSVVSTVDGQLLAEYELDALPAYDGMAAAAGKLFLSLEDGRLVCLAPGGEQDGTIRTIKSRTHFGRRQRR
ncbi:MAG: PQQ-binding-like beta-propeller repeat protein, partial [Planctomycetes bacterium]|nr:PQQ-binding-like beta-propeller repeat protein [Planctomycetota bacterium]